MRMLCVLLAMCVLLSTVSLAEPMSAQAVDFSAYSQDGRVTLIDGSCTDATVTDFDAAADVVNGVLDQLGGGEQARLEPWRTLTDAFGNRYYVFRQMSDNTTVLGGAVKVIADASGHMLGLTSSIVSDLPEAEQGEGISAEDAERLVLDHALQTRQQALTVVEGLTERMILPVTLEIDIEADDTEGSRYVWVVYTDNPESGQARTSELPYLAHYVTLSGEYLYNLPTIIPGDEAGASGFDAGYVFEFMEPVDYTGYVDLSTGGEREISVTLMRDRRTGMYYLGNIERRIVVADCWPFLYDGGQVMLEYSPDNLEWDQVGLISLYNYCRAYDYYQEIGWQGGDGLDTPILILNNYCDIEHKPVDNAAYAGGWQGWQVFLASRCNDFSQCLDVLAHEFTHCVTDSVMTYNAYMNDYGAINEAISDIQGKTCQLLMEGAENADWEIANRSTEPIRSMSEPHNFGQPAFTWDVYYQPNVKTPTTLNDRGGVHSNSSLLNNLAWRLYEKGGMSLEEGRAFWFTVDCAMVPGTDYPQLAHLLPWALRATGLEKYDADLRRALDATRLGAAEMPAALDEDRAMMTLTLPENPAFDDEQWILYLFSVDANKLVENVMGFFSSVFSGDTSVLPMFVQNLLNPDSEEGDRLSFEEEDLRRMEKELSDWLRERLWGVIYSASTNAGQDGRTMRMMCLPGHAVPLLIHGVWNEKTSTLEQVYILVYLGGKWIDVEAMMGEQGEDAGKISPEEEAAIDRIVDKISGIRGIDDALDMVFFHVHGGEVNALPTTGLEDIQPVESDIFSEMEEETDETPEARKSRPKLDEAADAAEPPAPAEAPDVDALARGYFDVVAGVEQATAGAALKTAEAASEVCAFAETWELYNPDVEPLRANMLAAFEAMDEADQARFWENFDAIRALLDDCLEDYEANRAVFEDAGVAEVMDEVMYDPLNRLAWRNLRDHTLTMGNAMNAG